MGASWTYRGLRERVGKAAGALRNAGVSRGDRVIVQAGKCPDLVAFYLACIQTATVYVPVNSTYTANELDYFIRDTRPVALVTQTEVPSLQSRVPLVWTLDEFGNGSLAQVIGGAKFRGDISEIGAADIASILYTSGTTGRPKGAMLTHENLLSNALALIDCWEWRHDDVLLHALPMFHVHGLFVALHCVLLTGSQMLFLPSFEVPDVLKQMPYATVMMGVPTFYVRLLQSAEFGVKQLERMRLFISGSAPLSEQVFRSFESRTGFRILERYGMTETLMNTSNPLHEERMPSSVGYALPGVEVRVADPGGLQVSPGEIGSIEVKGPNVFRGYWRKPEETAEEFRHDGWFKTGDMGTLDEDGRLCIIGREKDLIITGGLNVYPAEVETAIEDMDGIRECVVIGTPHPDWGEAVVAVVCSEHGVLIDDVRRFLHDRLAAFKHPKAVVSVDTIPKNAMGKVQKSELRKQYSTLFGG